jgi:hypothetical protein
MITADLALRGWGAPVVALIGRGSVAASAAASAADLLLICR